MALLNIGRSPLGVYYRSQLGVRERGFRRQGMWLCFIDKSIYGRPENWVYDQVRYNMDRGLWDLYIDRWGAVKNGARVCDITNNPWPDPDWGIIPENFPLPFGISATLDDSSGASWPYPAPVELGRPPSLDEFIYEYEEAREWSAWSHLPVAGVTILRHERTIPPNTYDSFTREHLSPGLDQFENWLDEGAGDSGGFPIPWREVTFNSTMWVSAMAYEAMYKHHVFGEGWRNGVWETGPIIS